MIAFDNETTGLLKPEFTDIGLQPYITEICCIKVDKQFKEMKVFDTLVKPGVPIPEELEQKIGITNKMVEKAPSFIEIYDELTDFWLGEEILIAHNAPFDAGVLKYELIRHDLQYKFPWPKYNLCTIEKSYHILNRRLNLSKLYEMATGNKIQGWHRAKSDVENTLTCLEWLVKEGHVDLDKL